MAEAVLAKPFRRKRSADSVLEGPGEAFTSEEVAEHCTEDDCYIVINGKVPAFDHSGTARLAHERANLRYDLQPTARPRGPSMALWLTLLFTALLWLLDAVCDISRSCK